MNSDKADLLEIRDLRAGFRKDDRINEVIHGVNLDLAAGETLALVGESGSGKTVTALSILQLYPKEIIGYTGGSINFDGTSILDASESQLRSLRGSAIGTIFQEPLTSLNPLHTMKKQLNESLVLHQDLDSARATPISLDWLKHVGLRDAERRLNAYPHQLSGGERQRVMIALAMINQPKLLIADEPTTALDVTIQAEVLLLIKKLQKETGMAVLFITHDLGIVKKFAERMAVMKDGYIVEEGLTEDLFSSPAHEYTKTLLETEPGEQSPESDDKASSLMEFRNLRVHFPIQRGFFRRTIGFVKAVDDVSAHVRQGQTLGIVGESGSGKTTLGKALLRLENSEGSIIFDGSPISDLAPGAIRPLRRKIQIIFQDPYGSLSPRMTAESIIGEGLGIHSIGNKSDREAMIIKAMEEVGLDSELRNRYPNQFSGGQRQRIALARALVLEPQLLILDEPTSSLDRTVQFQVIALLKKLQENNGLTYIFISHDMAVVRSLCHTVAVMKDGRIVETGSANRIFTSPQHPYTQKLLHTAFSPVVNT